MNSFTNFSKITAINEAARSFNNETVSDKEIFAYLEKVNKKIPKQVADIIYLTGKYNLTTQKDIDDIRSANKSKLESLSFKYNIPIAEMEDMWKNLKELKTNLRLLPQYQTISERKAFMTGKLVMSDITIDLDTAAGRNACAKQYMGMVQKIVSEYVGSSRLSKPELISAALKGFTDAMNTWRKGDKDDMKSVPFKTYAAYMVKYQILRDIYEYSGTISGNQYLNWKHGSSSFTGISLDGFGFDTDDEFKQDRIAKLGIEDFNDNFDMKPEDEQWNDLYKFIEGRFKRRDVDVFYRYLGLKGHNKEKGKDIAKSIGVSNSMITGIVNMIFRELKKDPKAMDILMNLKSTYNESIMFDIMNFDKDMMIEALLGDDTFILLEELTKWSNKDVYINTLEDAIDSLNDNEAKLIRKMLSGNFDNLDKMFKANKKLIIRFLSAMYATESFVKKSDVSLLEYMDELSELYKKYI